MKIKKLSLLGAVVSSLILFSGMVSASNTAQNQNAAKTPLNSSPTSQSKNPTGYNPK